MARVYAGALTTLVLDSELQKLSPSESFSAILAYIYCCGWSTRGWTLQEGNLARSCQFALKKGTVDGDVLAKHADGASLATLVSPSRSRVRHLNNIAYRGLAADWTANQARLWDFDKDTEFDQIWDNLVERTTGKPDDVPAIMANLMRISAFKTLKLPPKKRVSSLLLSSKEVPVGILFQTGPRFQSFDQSEKSKSGQSHWNRWVPTEIKGDTIASTKRKLHIKGTQLALDYVGDSADDLALILVPDQNPPEGDFVLTIDDKPGKEVYIEALNTTDTAEQRRQLAEEGSEFCLLLERVNLEEGSCVKGAQLVVQRSHGKTLTTIFDCPVRAMSIKTAICQGKTVSETTPTFAGNSTSGTLHILYGKKTP